MWVVNEKPAMGRKRRFWLHVCADCVHALAVKRPLKVRKR